MAGKMDLKRAGTLVRCLVDLLVVPSADMMVAYLVVRLIGKWGCLLVERLVGVKE